MSEEPGSLRKSCGRSRWIWAILILCGAGGAGGWVLGRDPAAIWPGEHWSWKTPESAGYASEKLAEFSGKAGGSGCLVHGGEMIHAWGEIDSRRNTASSSKPIYAFLVFKAIETGRLDTLDDRVVNWAPELHGLNPDLDHPDREITFRHLLSQTSGYGLEEEPGEAFAYNDYATGLLVWTLFHRVYGQTPRGYDDLLNGELLGSVLGFEDRPTAVSPRVPRGRIRMSPRDMARFALLYLHGGEWDGRRVLREDLFRVAMSDALPDGFPRTSGKEAERYRRLGSLGGGKNEKHHAESLGHFWWFNNLTPDGSRLLPDAPPRTFFGSGYGGKSAMVVIPELDLIAVWHGVYGQVRQSWSPFDKVGRFKVSEMLREVLAARTEPKD